MEIIVLAALNNKRVIGADGVTPWHLPGDLARFKQLTVGHAVVMGRKTFESIGTPLPDRRNVVLSRHNKKIPGVELFTTIDAALQELSKSEKKIFIIGGGEIYSQTIGRADRLMLTVVDNEIDGDVVFPPFEQLLGTTFEKISVKEMDGYRYEEYAAIR